MTTHFTGPMLNPKKQGGARQWFSELPTAESPDHVVLFEDFADMAFASNADPRNLWTVVKDASAAVANGTDALNGTAVLTSQATTDDTGASIQTTHETFALNAGKQLWFEAVFQVGDSEGSAIEAFIGLCVNFATNPEACLTAAERVGFQINDGALDIYCKAEDGGTESSADSGTNIADATDVKVGFHWDGVSVLRFFVNRALVATMNTTDHNIPVADNMAAAAYQVSGSATGTKSMVIDYIYVAQER